MCHSMGNYVLRCAPGKCEARGAQSGKGRTLRLAPPRRTRRARFPAPGSRLDQAPRSTRWPTRGPLHDTGWD
jgi:hypothetical protein